MKIIQNRDFVFHCDTPIEEWRAETMFTKEPGTIAWLQNNIRQGDIFWDVGANIGVYSLFAASLGATVYAFEPHVGSANSLLRNISVNKLTEKVHLLCVALDNQSGLVPFYYTSKAAGASGNQLHKPVGEDGSTFSVNAVELKLTVKGDDLDSLQDPQLVKIDTDGNEWAILGGMLRRVANSARSIQVETRKLDAHLYPELLRKCGMELDHKHFTSAGQKLFENGIAADEITHNVVYRKLDGSC